MEAEDILSKLAKKEPGQALFVDAAVADLFAAGMAAIRSGNRVAGGNALQQMAELMADTPTSAQVATVGNPAATVARANSPRASAPNATRLQ